MDRFHPTSKFQAAWQPIAWNGIFFDAPGNWRISKIGDSYLMLDDGGQPALDIQWDAISESFDARDYLSRIKKGPAFLNADQGSGLFTQSCALPANWQQALAAFEVTAFSWWEIGHGGKGVLIYCPICQTATMIRFYYTHGSRLKQTVALRLLSSFRDHRADDNQFWSLFDIRACLPRPWRLKQFRFQPAKYELVFNHQHQHLTLYRWGGPGASLKKTTLSQFAQAQVSFPWQESYIIVHYGAQAGEWRYEPPVPTTSKLLELLKPSYSFYWLRMWRPAHTQRLLGVVATGTRPFSMTFLNTVCADFHLN